MSSCRSIGGGADFRRPGEEGTGPDRWGTFEAHSRSGRTVGARYRQGSDRAVIISGGQHANETTGIVGALRAARRLAERPSAHFVISPLENPDGYQLHWRLRTGGIRTRRSRPTG
ncbi:M14 family zinc carboxypeptidase [Mesorhizobium sp. M0800]|uniref:M14 family zinc carboxypeptidase n=1 Tax=Mesorhizobium sp. M0800 TaxID=2957000 RepID=UPI003336F3AF